MYHDGEMTDHRDRPTTYTKTKNDKNTEMNKTGVNFNENSKRRKINKSVKEIMSTKKGPR